MAIEEFRLPMRARTSAQPAKTWPIERAWQCLRIRIARVPPAFTMNDDATSAVCDDHPHGMRMRIATSSYAPPRIYNDDDATSPICDDHPRAPITIHAAAARIDDHHDYYIPLLHTTASSVTHYWCKHHAFPQFSRCLQQQCVYIAP